MANFQQRVKELRKEKKLTQEQFADVFFLNKSSISRYEKGTQMPEADMLTRMAEYFDVSLDYLLGRSEHRKDSEIKIAMNTLSTDGLNDDDIKMIKGLIENLKKKNQK